MWYKFQSAAVWGAGSLAATLLLTAHAARAQDVYFSQRFANRQAENPAWAGLLDDYGATLSFRNQFPQLAGTFVTSQLAADWRLPQRGLHQALGLLVSQDRTGTAGYTRFSTTAQYAYHTRLTRTLALSGGAQAGYGRQRVGYDNLTFGDQYGADGTLLGPSAESLADLPPVNYLTLGLGAVLYAEQGWLSVSGQHLNQPNLGFRAQAGLPRLLSVSGGYKLFLRRPEGFGAGAVREISVVPTATYARQGGSSRAEAGIYLLADPVTLGLTLRNLTCPALATQQVLVLTAGVAYGDLRLGYAYDAALTKLAAELGGAHEITITIRAFDKLESAYRQLRRRNYPAAPCPSF